MIPICRYRGARVAHPLLEDPGGYSQREYTNFVADSLDSAEMNTAGIRLGSGAGNSHGSTVRPLSQSWYDLSPQLACRLLHSSATHQGNGKSYILQIALS